MCEAVDIAETGRNPSWSTVTQNGGDSYLGNEIRLPGNPERADEEGAHIFTVMLICLTLYFSPAELSSSGGLAEKAQTHPVGNLPGRYD